MTIVSSGQVFILSGGSSDSSIVNSGGTLVVLSGGTELSGVVSFGGFLLMSNGGFASGDTLLSGSTEITLRGATTIGDTVSSGGYLVISSGSTAVDTLAAVSGAVMVAAGGTEIASGGSAAHVVLNAGATEIVFASGLDVSGTVNAGATQTVSGGGTAIGDYINGGTEIVVSGGTAVATSGGGAALVLVSAGGVTSGAMLRNITGTSRPTEILGSGGSAIATLIDDDGELIVSSGGIASGATLISSPGEQYGAQLIAYVGGTAINIVATARSTEVFGEGGVISGATGMSGGQIRIFSGAAVNTVLSFGGIGDIYTGGTAVGEIVYSGATALVSSGGVDIGGTVLSKGTETVLSGGTGVNTSVASGAAVTVAAGGTEIASGDTASNVIIGTGGYEYALSNGVVAGGAIASGGSLIVSAGGTAYLQTLLGGAATVSSGGLLALSAGPNINGTIILSGGELGIDFTEANVLTTVISSFTSTTGQGDSIDLTGIGAYSSAATYTVNGDAVTVINGGSSITLDIAGATPGAYQLESDGSGGILMVTCFLEGTLIEAGSRDIAVEEIQPGDLLTVLENGIPVLKPVKWVGHRSVRSVDLPVDDAHPVRIRAQAFAEGMPRRDLLVTPEHCLFVDGKLIPARMLVNGYSIVIDRRISTFTFYHIEFEGHELLLAEGLPAESYLDTGNRGNFANAETVALRPGVSVDPLHKNWATHAVAPLTVDRPSVEPVWRMLEARGRTLGYLPRTPPVEFAADPAFHLELESGLKIWPAGRKAGRHLFMIPAGARRLRLRSRAARPADTIGPFVDDRRMLGVKIGEVALWHGRKRSSSTAHLDCGSDDGWFDIESNESTRWTNGDARFPLTPNLQNQGTALLEINVVGFGLYIEESMRAA